MTGRVLTGVWVQLALEALEATAAQADVLVEARELADPAIQTRRAAARIWKGAERNASASNVLEFAQLTLLMMMVAFI